ncbi:MAG: helix-turn-helix transcriptional regulator [Oscillospiraceae bacterium]|nr:helix-turn-helix transcriptional regulator [Oscillospiraceae bacterium]
MELGQKLKDARSRADMSQEALAKAIGVSRQTISNWENGRSYPDIGSLLKLSDLYGLSLDEMLKEDQAVKAHYENETAKKRRFWELVLEAGVVGEILGLMLWAQEFPKAGLAVTVIGVVLVYAGLIMHLRHFDHTRQEVRYGILGLVIKLVTTVAIFLFPQLRSDFLFTLMRYAGIYLVLCSGAWRSLHKSPRYLLYIVMILAVWLLGVMGGLKDAGALNEHSPFPHDYRVAQVLYPEDGGDESGTRVMLTGGVSYYLRIGRNGADTERIGTFTYQEPMAHQTELSIWNLVPEGDPDALYTAAVEADGSVTLAYSQQGELQYKWLLARTDTCSVTISTTGKNISKRPDWYPDGSEDPEPYLKEVDVVGEATLHIVVHGMPTEDYILVEEYHHGDSVEYAQYSLEPAERVGCTMKLATRYGGVEEYALYRIKYDGGEYRFTVTFGY